MPDRATCMPAFAPSGRPLRLQDEVAEVDASIVGITTGENVGFDVAERGLRLLDGAASEGVDDATFEIAAARMRRDDRLALGLGEGVVVDADDVHLHARADERHDWSLVLRDSWRRMERDGVPDVFDESFVDAMTPQERRGRVRSIDLEAVVLAGIGRLKAHVVEHRADVEELRIEDQTAALAGERAEEEDAVRMMVEELALRVADELVDLTGEATVGNGDVGDRRRHDTKNMQLLRSSSQPGEPMRYGQPDARSGQRGQADDPGQPRGLVRVGLVVFPGVQALDVAGPLDVFAEANGFLPAGSGYAITLVATTREPMRASNGLHMIADITCAETHEAFDLLLVAGGPDLPRALPDPELVAWLRAQAPRTPRYGSICTGAFLLGHAGLLDGKTVTTHWQVASLLAKQFPAANVERDRLHVSDGSLVTSAGVTAGIDLALALLHADHGPELALRVAKRLVVVVQRQGGQSQFSPQLVAPSPEESPIARVRTWLLAHLDADASVDALAHVAGMSVRNFSRSFKEETGVTPGDFVESVRIDAARNRLESSDASLKAIAVECGFTSPDHMRTTFVKRLGVTPSHYRTSFRA